MAQTIAHVRARLPGVLADIVLNYFRATDRTAKEMAWAGEWEECVALGYRQDSLEGACRGHHAELTAKMFELGENADGRMCLDDDVDGLVKILCIYDDVEGIRILLDISTDFNNSCLLEGCVYSAPIVRLAIEYGANAWDRGLSYACWAGNKEAFALMMAHGAAQCACGFDHSVDQMAR